MHVPHPPVEINPVDLSAYEAGAKGVAYVMERDSGKPGPTAVLSAIVHGNELCGAIVLDALWKSGFHPRQGRIILAFMNIDAYLRFDPTNPAQSRFVHEDFNRIWGEDRLDGSQRSCELVRARSVRPLIESADYLLDLHSTSGFSPPMILAGMTERSTQFAQSMGLDIAIVRDHGHADGRRMRDYAPFSTEPGQQTALLVECGQHWQESTVEIARKVTTAFLARLGMDDGPAPVPARSSPLTVTDAITATSPDFKFLKNYQGLEVIEKQGTVIALDGTQEVATPYDHCHLIMPTHGIGQGLTAVRFAREEPEA